MHLYDFPHKLPIICCIVVIWRTLACQLLLSRSPQGLVILATASTCSQSDVNVILVNWQKAARGQYARAVSNAELVGRLVGKALLSMVTLGTKPSDMHVIGFSLGAQVAGFIGETLKSSGLKLGRITGKCLAVLVVPFINFEVGRKSLEEVTTWDTYS
jgi:hypothetical protein